MAAFPSGSLSFALFPSSMVSTNSIVLTSFLCRWNKHHFGEDLIKSVHTHLFPSPSRPMGRWYIPSHRKVRWLVLTNRQLAGSDMWHSKPKHIVAVKTDSNSEREGHMCQTVYLWDTGDNIYLGPWVAMCTRTLQPQEAHCVRKKSQRALCQIASFPLHLHSTHTELTLS